jgi:hydrogenase nickel incorporation protein HypA/HybF
MHELSIALEIVDAAAEEARRHGGRPLAVHLQLGEHSGVVEEALLSAWELARQDSLVESAELHIELTLGRELMIVALEIDE